MDLSARDGVARDDVASGRHAMTAGSCVAIVNRSAIFCIIIIIFFFERMDLTVSTTHRLDVAPFFRRVYVRACERAS